MQSDLYIIYKVFIKDYYIRSKYFFQDDNIKIFTHKTKEI